MLRVNHTKWISQAKSSVDFLVEKMNGGYFGSTQATILALRALVEFMKVSSDSSGLAEFKVNVNGKKHLMTVGNPFKFPEKGRNFYFLTVRFESSFLGQSWIDSRKNPELGICASKSEVDSGQPLFWLELLLPSARA